MQVTCPRKSEARWTLAENYTAKRVRAARLCDLEVKDCETRVARAQEALSYAIHKKRRLVAHLKRKRVADDD